MNRPGRQASRVAPPADPQGFRLWPALVPAAGWLILVAAFIGLFSGHLAGQRADRVIEAGSRAPLPVGSRLRGADPRSPVPLPGSRERHLPSNYPPHDLPRLPNARPESGSIERILPGGKIPPVPIRPGQPGQRPDVRPGRSPGIRPPSSPSDDHHPRTTAGESAGEDPTDDRLRDLMAVAALLLIFLMAATLLVGAFRLLTLRQINTELWRRQCDLATGTIRQIDQIMICVLREDWSSMQAAAEQLTAETGLRVITLPQATQEAVAEFLAAALQCHHHRKDEEYLPAIWLAAEHSTTALRDVVQSTPLSDRWAKHRKQRQDTFTSVITAPKWSRRLR